MKVTFVYPDTYPEHPDWPGCYYLGIGTLSAVLKAEGHETSLIHIRQPMSREEFIERIRAFGPDLIGFSSTSHHAPYVAELASWIREEDIAVPTIYGGVHATLDPDDAIAIAGMDIICRAEGELPLVELCARLENKEDYSDIQNLWVKANGTVIKNGVRKLIADLDTLPFADRELFDYPNMMDEREGIAVFLASKGCPFDCTYCCNQALREVYGSGNKAVRYRSVDSVIAEAKEVLARYSFVKMIIFHDDIFFVKKSWAREFVEKWPAEVGVPFICNARADITDEEVVELLVKAGCELVKFGLESGNEEIRSKLLKRSMSNDEIKRAFKLCSDAGLTTYSFNMVGVPTETASTCLDTIKLNAEIKVDCMHASIFQPYHGTELAALAKEGGFVSGEQIGTTFFSHSVLTHNAVPAEQVLMFNRYFQLLKRYYQMLMATPEPLARISIAASDKILCWLPTSWALNRVFPAVDRLHNWIKARRLRAVMDRVREAPQQSLGREMMT